MLDRSKQYKTISSCVVAALLVAALLFLAAVVTSSVQANSTGSEMVNVGPFSLMELGKVPVNDGYEVSIALQSGLAYYLIASASVGLAIGLLLSRQNVKHTEPKE